MTDGMQARAYRVRIIAPVNSSAFNQRLSDTVRPVVPPDVVYDVRNIEAGSPSIESRYNLAENAMAVIDLAIQTEKDGFDGIFVTDFDMCGVEAAREVVDIPIIGGFPASAYTAMMLSERFSIITILDSTVGMQRQHVKTFGLMQNFASIRSIDCSVKDLGNLPKVRELTFQCCCDAVEKDGAQSFILGCTGFMDIAQPVSQCLTERYGAYVPVMDPNMTAFSYLMLLVRNGYKQSRLCYSKVNKV